MDMCVLIAAVGLSASCLVLSCCLPIPQWLLIALVDC